MNERQHWFYRVWSGLLLGLMAFFIVNIGLMWIAIRLFDRETILTRWK